MLVHKIIGCAIAVAIGLYGTTAGAETRLRLLSGFPQTLEHVPYIIDVFIKNVGQASAGNLKIVRNGPEVVSPFEQFQPVSSGAFDMLFTSGAYYAGVTGIGMAFDSFVADPAKLRDAGVFDWADKHFQSKHKMKLISIPVAGPAGYTLVLKKPIGPDGGLKDMKIRSTPTYNGLIESIGGVPVILTGAQTYSALEKGVVDGAAWPSIGIVSYKFHEVTKHVLKPDYGSSYVPILMNLNKWNALSAADRKILADEGRKIEVAALKTMGDLQLKEAETLRKMGIGETFLSKENAPKVEQFWAEGIWAQVRKTNGADADALYALAKEKGAFRK
jgi:TRAP-type C4-dicarboxylate transport system substrate-binding protein